MQKRKRYQKHGFSNLRDQKSTLVIKANATKASQKNKQDQPKKKN